VGDEEWDKGYGRDTGCMDYSGGGIHGNRGRERAGVRTRLSRELGRDSPGSSFVITTDTPDTIKAA